MKSERLAEVTWTPSMLFRWAGWLLGLALGGFFDGILLHQILQWHHLLSGVEGAPWTDLRAQVLADGLFHLVLYIVAIAGLWALWRTRTQYGLHGAGRSLWADVLIGFGAWHVADAVLSHWVLGIHRIRMDAANPLLWDVAWLAVFGAGALAVAYWLRRHRGGGTPRNGRAGCTALFAAVVITMAWSMRPSPEANAVLVMFKPGVAAPEALMALARIDATLLWSDASGQLWAVRPGAGHRASALYRHGAWWVSGTLVPAACLGWFKA